MMNVYVLGAGSGERYPPMQRKEALPAPRSLYVLDLPGYGYARASHAERTAFRRLITDTLSRPRLAGVLWLLDLRREPSADDRATQDLFAARETRVLVACTKSDTLAKGAQARRARALRVTLRLDDDQMIVTSARKGTGIGELREAVWGLVGGPRAEDPGLLPGVS